MNDRKLMWSKHGTPSWTPSEDAFVQSLIVRNLVGPRGLMDVPYEMPDEVRAVIREEAVIHEDDAIIVGMTAFGNVKEKATRRCRACGALFVPHSVRQGTCSPFCSAVRRANGLPARGDKLSGLRREVARLPARGDS